MSVVNSPNGLLKSLNGVPNVEEPLDFQKIYSETKTFTDIHHFRHEFISNSARGSGTPLSRADVESSCKVLTSFARTVEAFLIEHQWARTDPNVKNLVPLQKNEYYIEH